MKGQERYLSVTEAAAAVGTSTRALRLYEEKGLVKPVRTEGGWRAYGTQALARLHQILALKHMGLELSAIARLLAGSLSSLDSVLALQEQSLVAKQSETHRALDLVRRARSRLSSGETLSVDDLTTLTRETTMDSKELDRLLEPYLRKHFTPEEAKKVTFTAVSAKRPGLIEEWLEARATLEDAMKAGDATSPAAIAAAHKARTAMDRYHIGDHPDLGERIGAVFNEVIRDHQAIAGTALGNFMMTPALFDFFGRASEALLAQEAKRLAAHKTG